MTSSDLIYEEPMASPLFTEIPVTSPGLFNEDLLTSLFTEDPMSFPIFAEDPVTSPDLFNEDPLTSPGLFNEDPLTSLFTEDPVTSPGLFTEDPLTSLFTEDPVTSPGLFTEDPMSFPLFAEDPVTSSGLFTGDPVTSSELIVEDPVTEDTNLPPKEDIDFDHMFDDMYDDICMIDKIRLNLCKLETDININKYVPVSPSSVSIYTMTLNIDPMISISSNFVVMYLDNESEILDYINGLSKYVFNRQCYKNMRNSVILKSTKSSSSGTNTKVMKIFSNSKVQINGLKDVTDIEEFIMLYKELLMITFRLRIVKILPPRVSMMNSRFKIGICLDLDELNRYFLLSDLTTFLNLEIHHALRVKINTATFFIFSSGKVLVMGCKEISDIIYGYDIILNIIKVHYSDVYLSSDLLVNKNTV